jgi:hypothetical protein
MATMLAEQIDYYADHDLNYNYMALKLSVVKRITPERALAAVADMSTYAEANRPTRDRNQGHVKYADEDVVDMARLRGEGMTYLDVGDIFGVSAQSIYKTLKRRGLLQKGIVGRAGV